MAPNRFVVTVFSLAALCCSARGEDRGTCVSATSERIYGGGDAPTADGLAGPQMSAVGAIENEYGTIYCTGAVVSRSWVLSARHCAAVQGVYFRLAALGPTGPRLRLGEPHAHPVADLVLLELIDGERLGEFGVQPLTLATAAVSSLGSVQPGDALTLAGIGLTRDGQRGRLQFVDEPVTAVAADSITVDGRGRTGACEGDSGGPALRRSLEGSTDVVGVLSKGSSSCVGIDVYTRVDANAEWLVETMNRFSPATASGCD